MHSFDVNRVDLSHIMLKKNTQIKINPLLLQIRKQMNHVLYVIFSAVNIYANFISNNLKSYSSISQVLFV